MIQHHSFCRNLPSSCRELGKPMLCPKITSIMVFSWLGQMNPILFIKRYQSPHFIIYKIYL